MEIIRELNIIFRSASYRASLETAKLDEPRKPGVKRSCPLTLHVPGTANYKESRFRFVGPKNRHTENGK